MNGNYRNVLLMPAHSQALLHRAVVEGFTRPTDDGGGPERKEMIQPVAEHTVQVDLRLFRQTQQSLTDALRKPFRRTRIDQQALHALLLHDQIMLTGVDANAVDLGFLKNEGLLATSPLDFDTMFRDLSGPKGKVSVTLDQEGQVFAARSPTSGNQGDAGVQQFNLFGQALFLEPLLLKQFWSRWMRGLPNDTDFLTLRGSGREHFWRLMCVYFSRGTLQTDQIDLFCKAVNWAKRNRPKLTVLQDPVWEFKFVLFLIVVGLAYVQYLSAATDNGGCVLLDSRSTQFRDLHTDETRVRIAKLRDDAIGIFRLQFGQEMRIRFSRLTLRDVLTLRRNTALVGLRHAIDEAVRAVVSGDRALAQGCLREIKRARTALQAEGALRRLSTIVCYISVPVAIAELFLGGIPASGLFLGGTGAAIQFSAGALRRKNQWVAEFCD